MNSGFPSRLRRFLSFGLNRDRFELTQQAFVQGLIYF